MTTIKKICWIFGIYFACFFGYEAYTHWPLIGESGTPAVTTDWTKPWVMTCDNIRGTGIGELGYLYKDSEVFMKDYGDRSITFYRYFHTDRGNNKEVGLFFWDKVNHQEEGSWSQEYPLDHGRWKMEGNPEKGFTGWVTNKDGAKMNFTLKLKGR